MGVSNVNDNIAFAKHYVNLRILCILCYDQDCGKMLYSTSYIRRDIKFDLMQRTYSAASCS